MIRSRVPVAHQDDFDDRLEEARAAMDLRDDNGPTTAEWPLGLAAAGDARGRSAHGAVAGVPGSRPTRSSCTRTRSRWPRITGDGPTPAVELDDGSSPAARYALAALDAPMSLGDPEPAPPLELLPKPLADVVRMVQIVIEQLGMGGDPSDGRPDRCRCRRPHRSRPGVPGRLARAGDRSAAPGDVLVVPCTTPAYNSVLSLAGAVVTADGGPLSHAAVLARELGIPAVVGARGALTEIPDGALVEVDPVAGEVRIVADP